jgi:thiol-disulfide isomerase/thioredoxin
MWYSIRMTPFVIVSVVLFGLFSSWDVDASQEVVKLTDDTFEHQTQASTGSTTGSWLILFHVPNCSSCDRLKPTLDELGDDEELYENGIVLGSVDCSTNPNVCLRFSTTKLPVLMYLHKKRLYRYPLKKEHDEFDNLLILPDTKKLKSFVMKVGDDGEEGETIPDPPSAMDVLMKQITKAYEGSPLAGYAIFGMAGMIMLTILMLVVTLVFPSSGGGDGDGGAKTKKKTKKSSSKKKE